jgi:hypothetical protein
MMSIGRSTGEKNSEQRLDGPESFDQMRRNVLLNHETGIEGPRHKIDNIFWKWFLAIASNWQFVCHKSINDMTNSPTILNTWLIENSLKTNRRKGRSERLYQ